MDEPTTPSTPPETTVTETTPPASGSSGLDPKIAAGLAAIFPLVGGIIFLVIEKKNAYVRFYAMQSLVFVAASILLQIAVSILAAILSFVPVIGKLVMLLFPLIGLVFFAVWVITIIKAFSGVEWEIPYLGKIARRFLKTSPV